MALRSSPRGRHALILTIILVCAQPVAGQPPTPDYSRRPDASIFIGATPARVEKCSRQLSASGPRWDQYNEALAARLAFARRVAAMSELERTLETRRLNTDLAIGGFEDREIKRRLDLLLDARAREAGANKGPLGAYVDEMRSNADAARNDWLNAMADCITKSLDYSALAPQPPAAGDGSWTGTYVSRSYPTTFQFSGGGPSLSATFDGRFGDTHNQGSVTNCRPSGDGGFDCEYSYRHEDSGKTGDVAGTIHYTHPDRCTIVESASVVTAAQFRTLDGSPATSPSMYVGAKFGSNTYDRQGC